MQQAQLLKMHGSRMIQDVLMLMGKLTKTWNLNCLPIASIIGLPFSFLFSSSCFFEYFFQLALTFYLHKKQIIATCY